MDYRFFLDDPGSRAVGRRHVQADARGASLSAAFRLYYLLRPLMPIAVRQFLQRTRPVKVEDDWFIPAEFLAALSRSWEGDGVRIVHPWPAEADFGFVLTHDVETEAGVRNIEKVARIEEDLGFRSSWNVVPYKYGVDQGLVDDLKSRSFEIAIHGYNHDGRLFWSEGTFKRRAAAINRALRDYGAVGFRAPMAHRNFRWMQRLEIEYDSSSFDVDPFQAMPGGVGSIWPFTAGRFVELPYTMPQDHTVFVVLDDVSPRIWDEKLDWLASRGGMALMVTHPDYLDNSARLDVYRDFLNRVRDLGGYWHALPSEVTRWWRRRENSSVQEGGEGGWEVVGPASEEGSAARVQAADGDLRIVREPKRYHAETAASAHSSGASLPSEPGSISPDFPGPES